MPGPPVQYGDPITPQTVKAGYGFIDNGIIEKNLYFYHPDHLGSSSYITDREGRITQHTEYIAFGEVLFEEHSTSRTMPYLFNGKELDSETNLTYFGARYLDMKTSLWLNIDPLSGYNPIQETEHYIDGQHNNGEFNPMNHNTYGYTYNNPVIYVDPTGKQAYFIHGTSSNSKRWSDKTVNTLLKITNNKHYYRTFNWKAPLTNNQKTRGKAAEELSNFVIKTMKKGEDITLIGHSHGSNVAIQASKLIYKKTGKKVNIISIAAPAYNQKGDIENPQTQKDSINDHINLWNRLDGVSGELAGDDYYNNNITTNIELNVDDKYIKKITIWGKTYKKVDFFGAHSFDIEHPEVIDQAIKEGKIRKLQKVE